MFHLQKTIVNKYTTLFTNHINTIENNASLLLTIGEIDCRIKTGIWNVYKTKNFDLKETIYNTITDYLNFIEHTIKNKNLNLVIIQGVPYPNYSLDKYLNSKEKTLFLNMIKEINNLLKQKTLEKKWSFLDIFKPSSIKDKYNNSVNHIDDYHLKPSLYSHINKSLILRECRF